MSLLNQNATGTETNIQVHTGATLLYPAPGNTPAAAAGGDSCQQGVNSLEDTLVLAILDKGDTDNTAKGPVKPKTKN